MLSSIIASSEELAVLTRVLDDYCSINAVSDETGRSLVARRIIDLFGTGLASEAELHAALNARYQNRAAEFAA